MGLFSKKSKTYTNTTITRMMEDKDIPDFGKTALIDYLFSEKKNRNGYVDPNNSYLDYVYMANTNSIATRLKQARNWAKNNYAYEVPEGDLLNPNQVDLNNLLDEYLQTTLAKPVRIGYSLFGPANSLHITWQKLINDYDYDTTTNRIGLIEQTAGKNIYLEDIQIRYRQDTLDNLIDADTLIQNGIPATGGITPYRTKDYTRLHTPYVAHNGTEPDYAYITYCYTENGQKQLGYFMLHFLDYEYSGEEPADGLTMDDAENYDPTAIAPIITDDREEKDYFMVQYFIQEADLSETLAVFTYEYGSNQINALENVFTVSKQLGRYYPNIYFRLMGTNLASDVYAETDEYISSVKLCRKLSLNYKDVSDQLHESIGSTADISQMLLSTQVPVNTDDPQFIRYLYHYFYTLYGQLPSTLATTSYGTLSKEFTNGYAKTGMTVAIKDKAYESRISFKSIGYEDLRGTIGEVGEYTTGYEVKTITNNVRRGWYVVPSTVTCHTFCKQLTATTYRKITVYALSSTQVVRGGYTTTASGQSEDLYLPLDDAIAGTYLMKERMALYSKSLVIIINTIKTVKQKWYQTGIFKAVMFIIAVVIAVYTGGAGAGLIAVAYAIAQTIVISIAINILVKFAVDKLNLKLGGVFVVVAVLLIIVSGGTAASGIGSVMSMTAKQMMQVANYSIQIANVANQLELKQINKAYAQFADDMQDKFDALQDVKDELNPDQYLSPYYLLSDSIRGPDIRPGEQMNDFIIRTLAVDTGLATLDTIPNLVALTVRLPTFQETLSKIMQRGTN